MKRLIVIVLCLLCSPILEAAVAFRSVGVKVKGTAANALGVAPAGAADGDILVACLNVQNETPPAITGPSGWSNSFNGTTMAQATSTVGQKEQDSVWWIRRSGTPALTWTFSSSFSALIILAYSGALASGDPWSFGNTAARDDSTAATYPAVSGTTLDANEMLVWCGMNWQGGTSGTPPTTFTERQDSNGNTSDVEAAEKAQAAAGGTGSVTGASYSGGSNGVTTAFMGGLRPAASSVSCQSVLGSNVICGNGI